LELFDLESSDMEKQTPETDRAHAVRRRPSIAVIAVIAVGLGAAIGAAGVYATARLSGNAGAKTDAQCENAIALGENLRPLLTGDIAAMANRTEANDLSALGFNDGEGKAMTLADTGGKTRLVNLWATWCAPCREEMPALDALQAEKGSGDFEVVAISVDGGSEDKPRDFFEEIGVTNLSFFHDPTIDAFSTLKKQGLAFGLPVTLLVDEKNCVVANMNGPAHWSSPDAFRLIDAASGNGG
jgi:thiol-disulfide isomerase/thioredoxin